MRRFCPKHPLLWSAVVVFLFLASNIVGGILMIFAPPFFNTNGSFLQQLIVEAVMCLGGIFTVLIFGYGFIWNETKHFGRGLLCGGYIIVTGIFSAVVSVIGTIDEPETFGYSSPLYIEPLWRIAVFTVTMFLVGLTEEAYFRGVVSNMFWYKHAKDPAGIWTATLYSGLIFGLMHGINLIGMDADGASGVLVQMCAATVMGMAFTAIYYRCRNIWATVFLHAFLDFCGLLTAGLFGGSISAEISSYSPILAITNSLPYLIITLVLLRKKKLIQMLAEENAVSIPTIPQGQIVMSADVPSSEKSINSRKRAVIIVVICWIALFAGSVALNSSVRLAAQDFFDSFGISLGDEVISVENSGEWNGEQTFGTKYGFTVEKDGNYTVSVVCHPDIPNAYVLVQITKDGEICYEENYGGNCTSKFGIGLDKGDYELVLVYNYSEVTQKTAYYKTEVKIR